MNILEKEVLETGTLHLKDADGDLMYDVTKDPKGEESKKPVNVVLFGPASPEYAKANAKRGSRNLVRARKGKKELSADEIFEDGVRYLCDITSHFENLELGDLTGDALTKAVYSNRKLGFIADQVHAHVGDWENFSKASAQS
ncbi:hypothetical protein [Sphingomonas colocasiae]|uniref:Tail assembly chaperone n=1 Tax=Sphingomonas colocasiae TaxID=1848973 RepID=A0ABS7PXU0_9SPHN|nr:hypothetical protein [Sphingomonas colocasiae]MBY8826123.1 hypothetical protein [Sphingomonas colocasiae]